MAEASIAQLRDVLGGYFALKDFEEDQEYTLTISSATIDEVGQDREEKGVLSFLETKKKLVLNATRTHQLANLFGDAPLKGKKVRIAAEDGDVNGRKLRMVQIRPAE